MESYRKLVKKVRFILKLGVGDLTRFFVGETAKKMKLILVIAALSFFATCSYGEFYMVMIIL